MSVKAKACPPLTGGAHTETLSTGVCAGGAHTETLPTGLCAGGAHTETLPTGVCAGTPAEILREG